MPWPGAAAVIVSVVHTYKGELSGPFDLDGRKVPTITAFLFHTGPDQDPARLEVNAGKSFQGSIVLGMGFTFDDTDTKGVANTLADMDLLLADNPRNRERIFPYIGGEEVNTDPNHHHHRYVINFEDFPLGRRELKPLWSDATEKQQQDYLSSGLVPLDYPEAVAEDWPELLNLVKYKVKPERDRVKDLGARTFWWRFIRIRGELHAAIHNLSRVLLTNAQASPHHALVFYSPGSVFANSLNVFPMSDFMSFCILQSYPHELWARFLSSSMKDDLRYNPSDCFDTFPFPPAVADLECAHDR